MDWLERMRLILLLLENCSCLPYPLSYDDRYSPVFCLHSFPPLDRQGRTLLKRCRDEEMGKRTYIRCGFFCRCNSGLSLSLPQFKSVLSWKQDSDRFITVDHGSLNSDKSIAWRNTLFRNMFHSNLSTIVRFEVFTVVIMKNGVFWDAMPCGSSKNRRFGGT
jgi:hypothetical protein